MRHHLSPHSCPFSSRKSQCKESPIEKVPLLYDGRCAALGLNIVVVSADLGDLAATHVLAQVGHRVTLPESAPALGDVGTGIQVSLNVSRLLSR